MTSIRALILSVSELLLPSSAKAMVFLIDDLVDDHDDDLDTLYLENIIKKLEQDFGRLLKANKTKRSKKAKEAKKANEVELKAKKANEAMLAELMAKKGKKAKKAKEAMLAEVV
nr:hypothetical protein [Tanacetum cinerariifolium]